MAPFAYAKPPKFHYQTFDLKTLQFTNVPLFDKPPRPPAFAKQDIDDKDEEENSQGEPKTESPEDAKENSGDVPTDESPSSPQEGEPQTSDNAVDTATGTRFRSLILINADQRVRTEFRAE